MVWWRLSSYGQEDRLLKAETGAEVYRRGARDLGGNGAGARIEASESAL